MDTGGELKRKEPEPSEDMILMVGDHSMALVKDEFEIRPHEHPLMDLALVHGESDRIVHWKSSGSALHKQRAIPLLCGTQARTENLAPMALCDMITKQKPNDLLTEF